MYKKNLAGLMAVFLGFTGIHWFYLDKRGRGIATFATFFGAFWLAVESDGEGIFVMTLFAIIALGLITGLIWLAQSSSVWDRKYNAVEGSSAAGAMMYGNGAGNISGALPAADPVVYKEEGIRYYRSGDYDLALEAFQDAVRADPLDAGAHFNLAASYAKLGRFPEALQELEISVTHGLPQPERIETHPGFASLRGTVAFQSFRRNNYRRLALAPATDPSPGPRTAPATTGFAGRERGATRTEAPSPRSSSTTPAPATAPTELPPLESVNTDGDLLEQLNRLRELHDAGVLTPAEFRIQKERLLG